MAEATLPKEITLSLITLTGTRPEAFSLCCRWMMNQTRVFTAKPQWIIVDDGPDPVDQNLLSTLEEKYNITYIEQPIKWKPGKNTQRRNLITGLDAVGSNHVAIIEDDDYYSPAYLSCMIKYLYRNRFEAIGEGNAIYYHLPSRSHKRMLNLGSASLCQTVFQSKLIPELVGAANSGELFFDIRFWLDCLARNKRIMLIANTKLSVGIKGMPGRGNITAPNPTVDGYVHDDNLLYFKSLLKGDAKYYLPFMGVPVSMQTNLLQNSTVR